jgi:hypothetical protein
MGDTSHGVTPIDEWFQHIQGAASKLHGLATRSQTVFRCAETTTQDIVECLKVLAPHRAIECFFSKVPKETFEGAELQTIDLNSGLRCHVG